MALHGCALGRWMHAVSCSVVYPLRHLKSQGWMSRAALSSPSLCICSKQPYKLVAPLLTAWSSSPVGNENHFIETINLWFGLYRPIMQDDIRWALFAHRLSWFSLETLPPWHPTICNITAPWSAIKHLWHSNPFMVTKDAVQRAIFLLIWLITVKC